VSFYSPTAPLPSIAEEWGLNAAPLNQTREKTRNDLRGILGMGASGESLGRLTEYMNAAAVIAPEAVAEVEEMVAEWKTCDTARAAALVAAPWEGGAPLKKADVLEYDTTLLAGGDWAETRTAGLVARMETLRSRIQDALGIPCRTPGGSGSIPMIRS